MVYFGLCLKTTLLYLSLFKNGLALLFFVSKQPRISFLVFYINDLAFCKIGMPLLLLTCFMSTESLCVHCDLYLCLNSIKLTEQNVIKTEVKIRQIWARPRPRCRRRWRATGRPLAGWPPRFRSRRRSKQIDRTSSYSWPTRGYPFERKRRFEL